MKEYPHIISLEAYIRGYTYTAHLTAAGKLAAITAGCRKWRTFDEASAHYYGFGPYTPTMWSIDNIQKEVADRGFLVGAQRYARRKDALTTLSRLRGKVDRLKDRIKKKRARRRKA